MMAGNIVSTIVTNTHISC